MDIEKFRMNLKKLLDSSFDFNFEKKNNDDNGYIMLVSCPGFFMIYFFTKHIVVYYFTDKIYESNYFDFNYDNMLGSIIKHTQ